MLRVSLRARIMLVLGLLIVDSSIDMLEARPGRRGKDIASQPLAMVESHWRRRDRSRSRGEAGQKWPILGLFTPQLNKHVFFKHGVPVVFLFVSFKNYSSQFVILTCPIGV